jgi:CxxC-x17-CxxC domain-containing protein
LPKYNVNLKLMINGIAGSAFSAETLPPFPRIEDSNTAKIIKASRERYSTPRKIIEEKIAKWTGMLDLPEDISQKQERVLYDAKCSSCGRETKVIFPPDGSRPVYCKSCLKKNKNNVAKTGSTVSIEQVEPIYFSKRSEVERVKKRKEVNLEELKEALEESLKKIKPEAVSDKEEPYQKND